MTKEEQEQERLEDVFVIESREDIREVYYLAKNAISK